MTAPTYIRLAQKVMEVCDAIAAHTDTPGQINRAFLSPSLPGVHAQLTAWADQLGMTSHVDAAGNLRSRRASCVADAPTLYLGSHLDTVPNAGRYDGVLGVVMAYAVAEALHGRELPFYTEIVGFSEEEGVRYGVPYIGSRALAGTAEPLLPLRDPAGQTVADAIAAFGLDPADLPQAAVRRPALGYLEFHIEQGPVL